MAHKKSTNSKNLITAQIEHVSIDKLKPYERNARTHSDRQIQQIANSINEFGFTTPVLINDNNITVAGHGRVEAAKRLGMKEVPTIRLEHLTDKQIKAYVIADNKIAENAGWDEEILAIELQNLSNLDLDFDIEVTGFEFAEIDLLIEGIDDEDDSADELPDVQDNLPAVTREGDVLQLGGHRLYCGDALKKESYQTLLSKEKAHMIFTDAPFNVPVNGHVSGLGKTRHREFAMATGEMSESEFTLFLTTAHQHMSYFSKDGAIIYSCMDWRHLTEILAAARASGLTMINLCVWSKTNAGMGSFYRSQHELVLVFKNGSGKHINNVELGKFGRSRTNIWQYPGASSFGKGRMNTLEMHPTPKPVVMIADAIKDCTKRGHIVLDPFAGSGSTLIAAEKTGRVARCIELDPHYCDVIIRRWQELTGKDAVHIKSGKTFNELNSELEGGKNE